jgi:hypothetical protein
VANDGMFMDNIGKNVDGGIFGMLKNTVLTFAWRDRKL